MPMGHARDQGSHAVRHHDDGPSVRGNPGGELSPQFVDP